MSDILVDFQHGARALRGGFRRTLAALSCIALGLGATVFIVTVAYSILLRPPPFPDADRLTRIWLLNEVSGERADISYPDAAELRARTRSFDALEAVVRTRLAVQAADGTERVRGESVTAGYLGLIGIQAARGRLFTAAEYAPNGAPVILLSDALWRRKFGARPDIIGQTVLARGSTGRDADQIFTIVGVMPPGFIGTVDPDVSEFWLPAAQYRPRMILESRSARSTWVLARLRASATLAEAQAEITAIGAELARQQPELYEHTRLQVEPFGESWRAPLRAGLLMLSVAAALLLLITAMNVANVQLARMLERQPELVLRGVLGANRSRLVRQLLIENLVLAAVGGAAGILLGIGAVRVFVGARLFALPSYVQVEVSPIVIAVGFASLAVTALLFGALPAWRGSGAAAAQELRGSGRGVAGSRRERKLMHALVTVQVALAFLLLAASALMLRTYQNLLRTDVGYRRDHLLRMAVSLDASRFPHAGAQLRAAGELRDALQQHPGVHAVSVMAGVLPPFFDQETTVARDNEVVPALRSVQTHAVDDAFFGVLGIDVLHGRTFSAEDHSRSAPVAVVSETMARLLAGSEPQRALGMTVQLLSMPGMPARQVQIVGVVGDVKYHGPLAERPVDYDVYVPLAHDVSNVLSFAVRTDGDAAALSAPLQRVIAGIAPTSPQHWISTMEEELHRQYGDARLYAWLTAVFGLSALGLVLLGVYGVVHKSVNRRLPELAIRMAIGAAPARLTAMVMADTLRPLAFGLALGVAAALAGSRVLDSLVYGVPTTDPLTYT